MKRKKFFVSAGTGLFAFMAMRTFPFSLFGKTYKPGINPNIKVEINPLAVSRKKTGVKNG